MTASCRLLSAGPEDSVREGSGTVVMVGERSVALFRVEGACYAIANACPHRGGPLAKGEISGHTVTCPWHGWTWDVRTGVNVRSPASKRVECFPVRTVDGELLIQVPGDGPAQK